MTGGMLGIEFLDRVEIETHPRPAQSLSPQQTPAKIGHAARGG